MNHEPGFVVGANLRTPRAAAVSGIISSLLLAAVLVLLKLSTPSNITSTGQWLTDSAKRRDVALALHLVPFAGIAFLWFIGVIRDRILDLIAFGLGVKVIVGAVSRGRQRQSADTGSAESGN